MTTRLFLSTPIGWFEISGSDLGVRTIHLKEHPAETETRVDLPENHPVAVCKRQLQEYFEGKRREFDLKIDWSGRSDFHQQVWAELLKIPFGKTASYSDIAERVGKPAAVRAVGLANRNNPLAIVVPCHRVIGKAGELRGYFYGLDTKMQLLRHENPHRFAEQGELF
ncbi:MAG: methylated-DNA--[protein]-cysteine S-methyltransferase [Lewinellaceae bacterium]|nr:methylated-DNA--[protein]-cysteine S-methyltransferase [Saprospiraceae bacterium]MCB9305026.1 methylated-DNA--[protein]-cysteine S-methyltransferase [Lewinellaceae bacterium]